MRFLSKSTRHKNVLYSSERNIIYLCGRRSQYIVKIQSVICVLVSIVLDFSLSLNIVNIYYIIADKCSF